MNFSNLRFSPAAAKEYKFVKRTNPRLADAYTAKLSQIDDHTVAEDGSRKVEGGKLFHYVWVDLPGADEPNRVVIWFTEKNGISFITYLGLR
jgi:hypothetical protein